MRVTTRSQWFGFVLAVFGVVAIGPAAAKVEGDTIYLGAPISLTGKYSTNGKNTQDGYDLAVKRINEMGGVKVAGKSYKLKVVYYDDESTPARAAQLTERLINQDGIKYVLGAYSSGLTKAMAPVTEKYKIPHVEGNGAAEVSVGATVQVQATVNLGTLSPDDVLVELYMGRLNSAGEFVEPECVPMRLTDGSPSSGSTGTYRYDVEPTAWRGSGQYGYTVRVLPNHPNLSSHFLPGLVTWADAEPAAV